MNDQINFLGSRPDFLPPSSPMRMFTQAIEPLRIGVIDHHCDFTRIIMSLIPRHHEVIIYNNIPMPTAERVEGAVDILINHHEAFFNDMYNVPTIVMPYGTVKSSHVKVWNNDPKIIGIIDISGMIGSKFPELRVPIFALNPSFPYCVSYKEAGTKVITLILGYEQRFPVEFKIASHIADELIGADSKDYRQDKIRVRDLDALQDAKWLLHIKYDGFVCNAVMKALACGVPVIMDDKTHAYCFFEGIVINNHNGIVLPAEEIKEFLENCPQEQYERIKNTCIEEAGKWRRSIRWCDGWWRNI